MTVKRHCLVIPNDLQIYSNGTFNNSIIVESGGGNLLLGGTHINLRNPGLNTVLANFSTSADLYYNGTKKFETKYWYYSDRKYNP